MLRNEVKSSGDTVNRGLAIDMDPISRRSVVSQTKSTNYHISLLGIVSINVNLSMGVAVNNLRTSMEQVY